MMVVVARPVIGWTRAMLRPRRARPALVGTAGAARLMRPRRAAQSPAAPADSARGTIGAVANRGEDRLTMKGLLRGGSGASCSSGRLEGTPGLRAAAASAA